MLSIVQLEIDGRILAWLGGYMWDSWLFDDGVVHGGAGTCILLDWPKRHSTHVIRFALADGTNVNTLDSFEMRHNTPWVVVEVIRAFLECFASTPSQKNAVLASYVRGIRCGAVRWKERCKTLLLSYRGTIGAHSALNNDLLKFEGRTAPNCRV